MTYKRSRVAHRLGHWPCALGLSLVILGPWPWAFGLVSAQAPAQTQQPAMRPPDAPQITALLAKGWAHLAANDPTNAAGVAAQVLVLDPRSASGLALAVEAGIARGGGADGLRAYEQWLAARKVDDPYSVRRVAQAFLWEGTRNPAARLDALRALASDGDQTAVNELGAAMAAKRFGETATLASLGNEQAVKALIQQLQTMPGNKAGVIEALARSRSRLAIPPLAALLEDNNDDTKASAADALGRLGAQEAVAKLRPLVDEKNPFHVRLKAAGALARLGDGTGAAWLRNIMSGSEYPAVKLSAAREIPPDLNDAEWINTVRRLLGDSDPVVRLDAAQLIAPYDLAAARGVLDGAMQDGNIAVREKAGLLLSRHVAADFATLRGLLWRGDPVTRAIAAGRILELTR